MNYEEKQKFLLSKLGNIREYDGYKVEIREDTPENRKIAKQAKKALENIKGVSLEELISEEELRIENERLKKIAIERAKRAKKKSK